ncbi:MAG: acetoacetate decarboxylase family protein [Bacillota bacterium]
MKATNQYDEKILDNSHLFNDPFYKRFTLKPYTLRLDDKTEKTYSFPTFYGDVTVGIGIFTCSAIKAKELMPHPKMKPVLLKPGKAIVIFSCYEYKNVMGIPPYNEIAITVPVLIDPVVSIPALPMVMSSLFKKFGYYVFSMPVTSLENQLRGRKIWGLPKVVQDIDMIEQDNTHITTAKEEDGRTYFELRVPMGGIPREFDVSSNLYSRQGKRLLQAETNFKAVFNVNKKPKQLATNEPWLKLYDTPNGKLLKRLEIDEIPFQFRFAKHMTACFDLPNSEYKAPFQFK